MTDTAQPTVSLIPNRPAELVVGDRRIPIDDWPLGRSVSESRPAEPIHSDGVLRLEPARHTAIGIAIRYALALVAGVLPVAVGALAEVPEWVSYMFGFAALLLVTVAIRGELRCQRRWRFDLRTRAVTIDRRTGFRRSWAAEAVYPLSASAAVQLLYSGRHSVTEPIGGGEQQSISYREFDGYELNLILSDDQVRRLNIASVTDWEWVRTTGGAIAEFLRVPVIDRLYHGA